MIVLNEQGTPELNVVHHCRAEALLSALDSNSIDMGLCSPPYDDLRRYNGFSWNFEYIAQQTYRVLKPGGVLVWVVGDATVNGSESLTSFKQAIHFVEGASFRLHDTMIYRKNGSAYPSRAKYSQVFEYMFVLSKGDVKTANLQLEKSKWGGQKRFGTHSARNSDGSLTKKELPVVNEFKVMENVWDVNNSYGYAASDDIAYEHPAIFPESLAERHILTWSNAGDVVLDFFGGSGTTAKMARRAGRDFITNDISREYCDLMERRLAQPYTPSFMPQLEAV